MYHAAPNLSDIFKTFWSYQVASRTGFISFPGFTTMPSFIGGLIICPFTDMNVA